MNVGQLCQRDVVTITAGASLTQAAQLMRAEHVGFLIVIKADGVGGHRRVIGVLSDRDIVTAVVAREADARVLTVGDVMTCSPLMTNAEYSIEAALRHMREQGVRRVPVLGAHGELVGVLSLDDVLEALAVDLSVLSATIRSGPRNERFARP
jgi:CBS domain-containing protein